jgi:hypothetical protein
MKTCNDFRAELGQHDVCVACGNPRGDHRGGDPAAHTGESDSGGYQRLLLAHLTGTSCSLTASQVSEVVRLIQSKEDGTAVAAIYAGSDR